MDNRWPLALRVAFRYAFAYFVLFLFPFPLNVFRDSQSDPFDPLVVWTAKHVFGLTIVFRPGGSGDTTYSYVEVFCFAVIALVATIVWSIADRRRENYTTLHRWLRVYLRFALATIMIGYGAAKVFQAQFPPPPLDRLLQPFGDASPMGLLWTFMGASKAYNVFTGGAEILGGVLLTTRRTTLLGALVCIGVVSNIVMLNFAYDVPVKLYSSHLLLISVFLVLPDARRLYETFVTAQPKEWMHVPKLALRTLFIGFVLYTSLKQGATYEKLSGARSPLRGIWNVEEFELDGKVLPANVVDASRWRRVIFDYPHTVAVQLANDSRVRFGLTLDMGTRTMSVTSRLGSHPVRRFALAYALAGDAMTIQGKLEGQQIRAKLRRAETPAFLLTTRGFHWINEVPFNR